MSDLHVVAVIAARSGSEDELRSVLSGLVDPTRAEHGCLAYDLFESASMPGTFITVELWRDQSDVDAHMQTAHIAAALAASEAHLAAPPGIHPLVPVTS
ncbi:MAG: antibiotic biosynthesis monooxygenase [Actinomycetota bacterium]|nr:antibiotic biosynthesis monooxygenase [Actinomycetota bacterium]